MTEGEKAAALGGETAGFDEQIKHLAGLPVIKYEQCRKAEAKHLDLRVSALDDAVKAARGYAEQADGLGLFNPEPWPAEVDGDSLLDEIVRGVRRYIVMSEEAAYANALWVTHTHCFERWHHTPRLSIEAPQKGCGKSTLLDVDAELVPRAITTENLTTAPFFRAVDKYRPTLLIDEVDTFLRDNDELRGAINAGHKQGGVVLRCDGDDNALRGFKTFAPVAMAGIGTLPPTLSDRSIRLRLHRRKPDEKVEDFRPDRADYLRGTARKVARWVLDHGEALSETDPKMPPGIHNRLADNWRPLLCIADVAGGAWPERARQAAVALTGSTIDDTETYGVMVLADIRRLFESHGTSILRSATICADLAQMEDRPWPEYGRSQKPISARQLAKLLAPFGISPGTVGSGKDSAKGYKLEGFQNAFARYLGNLSVAPSQAPVSNGFGQNLSVAENQNATDRKCEKHRVSAGCDGATDKIGDGDIEERLAIMEWDGEVDLVEAMPDFLRRSLETSK